LKKSTGIVDDQKALSLGHFYPPLAKGDKGDSKIMLKNLPCPLFAKEGYKGPFVLCTT
jgi:hypothetical protein